MRLLCTLACVTLLSTVMPVGAAAATTDPVTDFMVAVENLDRAVARTSADLVHSGDLVPFVMGFAEDKKPLVTSLRTFAETAATLKATIATIPRPWASADVAAIGDEMAALPARAEEVEKAVRKIRASNRPQEITQILVKGNFRDNWPSVRAALASVKAIYDTQISPPVSAPPAPAPSPAAPAPLEARSARHAGHS